MCCFAPPLLCLFLETSFHPASNSSALSTLMISLAICLCWTSLSARNLFVILFVCFVTESLYGALTVLELTMETEVVVNSRSSTCFCLPSVQIKPTCQHNASSSLPISLIISCSRASFLAPSCLKSLQGGRQSGLLFEHTLFCSHIKGAQHNS